MNFHSSVNQVQPKIKRNINQYRHSHSIMGMIIVHKRVPMERQTQHIRIKKKKNDNAFHHCGFCRAFVFTLATEFHSIGYCLFVVFTCIQHHEIVTANDFKLTSESGLGSEISLSLPFSHNRT